MQIKGLGVFGLAGCSWLKHLISPVGTAGGLSDSLGEGWLLVGLRPLLKVDLVT